MKDICAMLFGLLVAAIPACAQTWTQTLAPITNWISVASSADGTKLVAVGSALSDNQFGFYNPGPIYTSTNSGAAWILQTNAPNLRWLSVASSADGNFLVAAAGNEDNSVGFESGIFTSTNAGVTWVSNNLPAFSWQAVASSAAGSQLMAIGASSSSASIFTSTNFGTSWISNNVPTGGRDGGPFQICALSAGGTTLLAGGGSGTLALSTNSGGTWTRMLDAGSWTSFSSSADGSKLVAVSAGPQFYYSSANSGITWTTNELPLNTDAYYQLASSSDGTKLVAIDGITPHAPGPADGPVFTSTNFGTSWVSNSAPVASWVGLASSADGAKLMAAVSGGGIYTLQMPSSPQLNITFSGGNLNFSWIVPSTTMVLEESRDLIDWTPLTNAPTLDLTNLQEQLTLPPANCSGFFRLVSL